MPVQLGKELFFFRLKSSRCVDDKYFSICSRHDSTITHASLRFLPHIMIGTIRSPCCYDAQTSRRSLFSSLFLWTRGGHAVCYLHSSSLFVGGFKYQPFQCPLVGVLLGVVFFFLSTPTCEKCSYLTCHFYLYFFFVCLFVQCFTPNQPQNNK